MKSKVKVLLLFGVIISSVIFTQKTSAQEPYVSFQVFYDQLSPYGEWVDYPNWGYVWIPDAGPDFAPYSSQGRWIYTDYGWTWLSDYSWGWAPFHYGRWDYDHYYGWFWIPDNEWGPAWVSWRRSEGYYGWAPLEPGISLSISFGRGYDSHNDHWIFVRDRDIDRADINHYYVSRNDHDRIVRRSSVINTTYVDNRRHTTYVTGPGREDFQKVSGKKISPVAIKEYDKPGHDISNGQVRIYRPEVVKNNERGQRPSPSRITNLKDVKQPSQRQVMNQPSNANPAQNVRREEKPNNVKTQNTNAPQNVRREEQPANVKPQNANPARNVRREEQPANVKPQNANPARNVRREEQPANVKPQNANPPQNVRREEQPNNVKPQNTNPPQNLKKEVQPNTVKQQSTNPGQNVRREEQSNTSKASRNNKREQKKSNAVRERRKKD